MNRIIFLLLILSALLPLGVDVAKINAATQPRELVPVSYKPQDMRITALQNVMKRHNSPLAPYAQSYVKTADQYDMDWRLLPAIAGLESSFGKHQLAGSHNSYGWGGGRIYFDSVEDGIDTVLYGLKNRYASRGAVTVEQIAPIYAESPTWAPRVRSFMAQFDTEFKKLTLETLTLTI